MNHQPFENWLLSDEPLEEQETDTLQGHLESCEQCSNLQNAWQNVEKLFAEAPDMQPAPGFVSRWQQTLEADRAAALATRQRWQSWIVAVLIANGTALAFVLLGMQLFRTYTTFTDFVLAWVYRAAVVVTLASGVQNVFSTLLRTIPGIIPTSWVSSAIVVLSVSVLIWIFAMKKLSSLPRRTT